MAYTSDDEQLEALRRWWQANGRAVIAGVVIAVAVVVGWQLWQQYQESTALSAAGAYGAMLNELEAGNTEAADAAARNLREEHAGSPYPVLGALRLGGHYTESGELRKAETQLRWAVENAGVDGIRQLARLRLAEVLLASGQPDDAVAVLESVPEGSFRARAQELLGDAHLMRSDREAAATAYRSALEGDGLSGQQRQLVQTKLNDLGLEAEPAS